LMGKEKCGSFGGSTGRKRGVCGKNLGGEKMRLRKEVVEWTSECAPLEFV